MPGRSIAAAADRAEPRAPAAAPRWLAAVAATLLALAAVIAIFRGTAGAVLAQWLHSSAYNHSFLILPIVAYLIWSRRRALARLQPAPLFPAALLLPAFGVLWWLAHALRIAEAEQFALAFMLEAVLLAILGWPVYRALIFPFAYALLIVPTGDFLLGPLQGMATQVASYLLRLTGIPVFVEGTIIETPTGSFAIAAGCAGLNFLLASLALSLLFADLLYRRRLKRVVCVAAALALSVAVNWVRIYAIIAFDYFTNHRTSIVDDHLLYGWGFFTIVMAILLWLAQRLQDPVAPAPAAPIPPPAVPARRWPAFAAAAAASIVLAGAVPGLAGLRHGHDGSVSRQGVDLPQAVGNWHIAAGAGPTTAPGTMQASYLSNGHRIEVRVGDRPGGAALLAGPGAAEGASDGWIVASGWRSVRIDGAAVDVRVFQYAAGSQRRTAWQWYWIGGHPAAGRLAVLWLRLRAALVAPDAPTVAVTLTADQAGAEADALLQDFVDGWDMRKLLRPVPPAGG